MKANMYQVRGRICNFFSVSITYSLNNTNIFKTFSRLKGILSVLLFNYQNHRENLKILKTNSFYKIRHASLVSFNIITF